MSKIKTAREILLNNHANEGFKEDDQCTYDISIDSMIEFANLYSKQLDDLKAKERKWTVMFDSDVRVGLALLEELRKIK